VVCCGHPTLKELLNVKKRIQGMVIGVLATLLLLSAIVPAYASYTGREITALFGVRLLINGEEPTITDAAGNVVQPFIWEGRTYVPIGAVAEGLGATVSWDDATSTASVTMPSPASASTPDAFDSELFSNVLESIEESIITADFAMDLAHLCKTMESALSLLMSSHSGIINGFYLEHHHKGTSDSWSNGKMAILSELNTMISYAESVGQQGLTYTQGTILPLLKNLLLCIDALDQMFNLVEIGYRSGRVTDANFDIFWNLADDVKAICFHASSEARRLGKHAKDFSILRIEAGHQLLGK
jgi:drug/metabolite transporter superfamily protein YnfA